MTPQRIIGRSVLHEQRLNL